MGITRDSKIVGIKAEKRFEQDCKEHEIDLIKIPQDKKSKKLIQTDNVKRADYIAVNAKMLLIEVKCRTFNKGSFYITYSEHKRLEQLQNISQLPVLFTFYRRDGKRSLRNVKPYLISNYKISGLLKDKNSGVIEKYNQKQIWIPTKHMERDLNFIREFASNKVNIEIS